jgi:RNA polymerase I-specific transcription initiation factor RRN7
MDLLPKQLNQYLDFYSETFLDHAETQRTADNDDFKKALYDMFSIESTEQHPPSQAPDQSPHERSLETVRAVQGSMKTRAVVSDDEDGQSALRPGQAYPRWKTAKELPDRAATFYDEAARLAGLSMEMLVTAVDVIEARLEGWRRKQREGKDKVAT